MFLVDCPVLFTGTLEAVIDRNIILARSRLLPREQLLNCLALFVGLALLGWHDRAVFIGELKLVAQEVKENGEMR